ncbi:MAG TPA: hypothetical protein V6C78_29565 [Crinalium sp.]|jgi:hypothetical protein
MIYTLTRRFPILAVVLLSVGASLVSLPAFSAPTSDRPTHSTEISQRIAQARGSTYREPNGLFEISFPSGYTFSETGSGISFASRDQSFAGSVKIGSAHGRTFTLEQLEGSLKAEYGQRLHDITWQGSSVQPDGSLRVDWVGTDSDGNDLDAVSFIEQHGNTIFILDLFGVNEPYANYNSDAEAIVGTYRVRQ